MKRYFSQGARVGVIDDYIAGFEGVTRSRLEEVYGILGDELVDCDEVMSYALATFDLDGRHVVHFGGFARHVGLYPTPQGVEAFEAELDAFPRGKGSVQFPHDRPLPVDLIRRIARYRRDAVALLPPQPRRPR